MPTSIYTYYQNAQLSMAAYATLSEGMASADYVTALKEANMSDAQARNFAGLTSIFPGYTILSQRTDVNGFSATLFQNNATGEKTLAIRGTDDLFDLWTDIVSIGLLGTTALQDQYYSLKSYYEQLITEGKLGAAETFSVTGHSLGGHLAMILSRLAPSLVDSVYTYNAPGFDPLLVSPGSSGFFNLLRDAAGTPVSGPIGTDWNADSMFHLNVPGDIINGKGNTPGHKQTLFSESANQGPFDAHAKEPLTDALAVAALLADLDPRLSLDSLRPLFEGDTTVLHRAA